MAQKDNTLTTDFDASLPPNSLIGLEYHIPGIKESPVLRAIFSMLYTERARRISDNEQRAEIDPLFKKAFERLLQHTILICEECGAEIAWDKFLGNPFGSVCSDSCEEKIVWGSLQESDARDPLSKNLQIYSKLNTMKHRNKPVRIIGATLDEIERLGIDAKVVLAHKHSGIPATMRIAAFAETERSAIVMSLIEEIPISEAKICLARSAMARAAMIPFSSRS